MCGQGSDCDAAGRQEEEPAARNWLPLNVCVCVVGHSGMLFGQDWARRRRRSEGCKRRHTATLEGNLIKKKTNA